MSFRFTILFIIALSLATYMNLKSEEISKETSVIKNYKYRGQVLQDQFVLSILKHKKNGFFVEVGSGGPININNTYIMETELNWSGFMIEISPSYLPSYKKHRPKSIHIIKDATKLDYKKLFTQHAAPKNIDYLQIDVEVTNNSTLSVLEKMNHEVMDEYKFAIITFEHDIYRGDHFSTRKRSREILTKRGYILAFPDVLTRGSKPFEDWYLNPDLVDMSLIDKIKTDKSLSSDKIIERIRSTTDI